MVKKILITGGAGYIGSMLTTRLLALGYQVTVVDKLKYNNLSLAHLYINKNFNFFKEDIRNIDFMKKIVKNYDLIIPLAALVGAPLCEKNKKEALEVNLGSIETLIKILNVKQKIIYPTTNSGYGIGSKSKYCTEKTQLNPISLYGSTKVNAEKIILSRKNSISLRLATVFGYSYRMRTDLLVNNFVLRAVKENKIELFEPHFRRNFIHIDDVVNGFIFSINNFTNMRSNAYNLGLSKANLTKLGLVNAIKRTIPSLKITINNNKKDPDKRDYFVSNKKIEKKGFKAKVSILQGIKELKSVYMNNDNKFKNNY